MYNSQYYTCEQIDERLLQGYVDDYNTQTGQSLTKEQFLTKLGNIFAKETIIDNTAVNIGYYTCDTAAGTAAKVLTVAGYELFQGGSIKVKFINRNTAGSATLNINSNGAKTLYYGGKPVSASNSWDNNEVVEIFYDGTSYYANNIEGNFNDGVFDISAYNLTEGQPTKYATLAEALGTNGANVPAIFRNGGMQIKYVSTYDNNYIQFRCKTQAFSANPEDWYFCGNETLIDNPEFAEAKTDSTGKLLEARQTDGKKIEFCDLEVKGDFYNKGLQNKLNSKANIADVETGLSTKVDKETGKSLINSDIASSINIVDNPEWLDVTTDNRGKILKGIKNEEGEILNIPLTIPGVKTYIISNTEWAVAVIDNRGRILCGLKSSGEMYSAKTNSNILEQLGFLRKDGYAAIKEAEKASVLKKFVPYTVGTPSNDVSIDDQYNRVNLMFFTDSHIDLDSLSLKNVDDAVDFANTANIAFDAVLHGGDVITPFNAPTKAHEKMIISQFFDSAKKSLFPFIFTKGNHDLNDWDNTPQNTFNDADWSEMWYDFAEEKYGIVRQLKSNGEKSTWGYYDIPTKKVRIIFVDTQDSDKEAVDNSGNVIAYGSRGFYISNEQMQWLANTGLNVGEGWGIICLLHQCISPSDFWYSAYNGVDYEESSIEKFFNMCAAFNAHQHYTMPAYQSEVNSFYDLSSIEKDFSTMHGVMTEKPSIIAWLVGHNHIDRNVVRNGVNIIWTLNNSANTSSSDARVARVPKTPTQNAFDLISIDTREKKIRYIRYGAGSNCYGSSGDRFIPDGLNY